MNVGMDGVIEGEEGRRMSEMADERKGDQSSTEAEVALLDSFL